MLQRSLPLVCSRHRDQLRAASSVVENVEMGGEGRRAACVGELDAVGAGCVLSEGHGAVQAGAYGSRRAVGQHYEVGCSGAGHGWSLAEVELCGADVLDCD